MRPSRASRRSVVVPFLRVVTVIHPFRLLAVHLENGIGDSSFALESGGGPCGPAALADPLVGRLPSRPQLGDPPVVVTSLFCFFPAQAAPSNRRRFVLG